jgi:hypothetical protein
VSVKKIGTVAAAVAAGVGLVLGGAALANAATTSLPGAVRAATTGTSGTTEGQDDHGGRGPGGAMHAHTPVTGDEATKVGDAVKAEDSAVTVTSVQKDEDGSYDVAGTKAGQPVFFDVSKDLKTVSARTGGPGGRGTGGPGKGGSQDTPVTGGEATKVGDAVKAEDSAVTVTSVRKDPDGSYDVLGTKAGEPVFFEVSKDLATVEQRTGGPGGRHGGHGADDGQRGSTGTPDPSSSSSSSAQSSGFNA